MLATSIAEHQAGAFCVVACAFSSLADTNDAAISLLAMTGGDALGDDRRLLVAAEVNHLGAGVGLLMMMGEGDRIEFADRVIAAQDAARIFPGHRRAGLDLRPRDLARHTTTIAAFGDEVVDEIGRAHV